MSDIIASGLTLLVVGSLGIILFDLFFLAARRVAAQAQVADQFGSLSPGDKKAVLAYRKAQQAVLAPPVLVEYARSYFAPVLVLMVGYQLFFQKAEFDFPLLLVMLVFGSGGIWLFDALYLGRKRRALVDRVGGHLDAFKTAAPEEYREFETNATREPLEVEYSKSFFPVLFIVLVLRSFVVEPFQIPSESMLPTLEVGDFILVNKFTYGIRLPVLRTKVMDMNQPERGEVMVFFPPHKKQYFIKRVIGLPGDEIHYINNVLYINGEKMPQRLVASLPPGNPQFQVMRETLAGVEHAMRKHVVPGRLSRKGSWVVPDGHYFMMGDNRDNSTDSREWGPVPEGNIVGKAFGIWMHWDGFFSLPSFSRVGSIQ